MKTETELRCGICGAAGHEADDYSEACWRAMRGIARDLQQQLREMHLYFITDNVPAAKFPDDDEFLELERDSEALITMSI